MMKALWTMIDNMKLKRETKSGLLVFLMAFLGLLLGAILWVTVFRLFLPGFAWLLCFMGYGAVVTGFVFGILYMYRHDFM